MEIENGTREPVGALLCNFKGAMFKLNL